MNKRRAQRSSSSPLPSTSGAAATSECLSRGQNHKKTKRTLLAALAPVLILSATQIARLTQLRTFTVWTEKPKLKRLGLVNFVDDEDKTLWGVYSIHEQMKKVQMTAAVEHIAVVSKELSTKSRSLLDGWLGKENVREIDRNFIINKIDSRLDQADFLKVEAFNMTEFDKLIVLDPAVLLLQNIEHWFDYPLPAATQIHGTVEWSSGSMVINPNTSTYMKMLKQLPLARPWDPKRDEAKNKDTWESSDSLAGFLSSFFRSDITDDNMLTMRYASCITSSDLEDAKPNWYYWKHRPWSIESVHFTRHKPWDPVKNVPKRRSVCIMLNEWLNTVADAPRKELPILPNLMHGCEEPEVSDGGNTQEHPKPNRRNGRNRMMNMMSRRARGKNA